MSQQGSTDISEQLYLALISQMDQEVGGEIGDKGTRLEFLSLVQMGGEGA